MKMKRITAGVLSLLCAAALTACGAETIDSGSDIETVLATDTTAAESDAVTTSAEETKTTAVTEKAADTTAAEAADTTAAESTEAATTAAEATTAPEEKTTEAPAQQTEAPATEPPKEEKHIFEELKIGSDPAAYIAAHTNYQRTEADSCLGNGKDINYYYPNSTAPDYKIWSILENGTEKVHEIEFVSSALSTKEGIHIDSTLAEVIETYGAEDGAGYFKKKTADGTLEIFVRNGLVAGIILSE